MSRQREQITRALADKGYTVERMWWEPIGAGAEMAGPSGGWFVETDDNNMVCGLSVADVLESIGYLAPHVVEEEG